jgi:hypothetical protein
MSEKEFTGSWICIAYDKDRAAPFYFYDGKTFEEYSLEEKMREYPALTEEFVSGLKAKAQAFSEKHGNRPTQELVNEGIKP